MLCLTPSIHSTPTPPLLILTVLLNECTPPLLLILSVIHIYTLHPYSTSTPLVLHPSSYSVLHCMHSTPTLGILILLHHVLYYSTAPRTHSRTLCILQQYPASPLITPGFLLALSAACCSCFALLPSRSPVSPAWPAGPEGTGLLEGVRDAGLAG